MSDTDTPGTEATTTEAPAATTTETTTPETPAATDQGKTPDWDGEFDADRAKRLVENLRADLAKKDAALKAATQAKGETEKTFAERLAALEAREKAAERQVLIAEAVAAHGVPEDLVEFLTADTADGLKAQAERLAKAAKKPADDVPGKPRPALKNGTGTDAVTEDFDPSKVAAAIRRR